METSKLAAQVRGVIALARSQMAPLFMDLFVFLRQTQTSSDFPLTLINQSSLSFPYSHRLSSLALSLSPRSLFSLSADVATAIGSLALPVAALPHLSLPPSLYQRLGLL